VKAAEGGSFARTGPQIIIGIFAVRNARMQTSENVYRPKEVKPRLAGVLCADMPLEHSRQMPVCRVTRRPERTLITP